MSKEIINQLRDNHINGKKCFSVLIDPDKVIDNNALVKLLNMSQENKVDYFFVGGSLITTNNISQVIGLIKMHTNIPVILFPGSTMQIDSEADAILFLSLISGRNPDLLIGQHVIAAPILKKLPVEVIPTGYMLVNAGNQTTVSYMSNTQPIPYDKPSVAACTAMAGEMLGLQLIYMDAGSGAQKPISIKMISAVRKSINTPLIVGGGITSPQQAEKLLTAGADMIVIGNGIEKDPELLITVSDKINEFNEALNIHK